MYLSLRRLCNRPASTTAVVVTLALGIAVSTAVFTLANAVVFRALPYPAAEQLVAIDAGAGISWQDVRDLRAASQSIVSAAAYTKRTWGLTDSSIQPVQVTLSGMVTPEFFATLGVQFSIPAHDRRVVWLTHALWNSRFGGDPAITNKTISLNDMPYRVAGVLPAWFRFPINGENPDLYIPLDEHDYCCQRDARMLAGIARVVSLSAARAELALLSDRLRVAHPDTNPRSRFMAEDLQTALTSNRRRPLLLLLGAACVLMLIAAANAGGILLARAARETRDSAIRVSLGAGWRDLLSAQLAEGLWLSGATALAGVAGAYALLQGAAHIPAIAAYAQFGGLHPDSTVVAFSVSISLAGAMVSSLLPLAALPGISIKRLLRSGISPSKRAILIRTGLTTAQIALSVTLLASGGLILRSLYKTLSADRGYQTEQVVLAGIGIPEARYDTDAKMIAFHEQAMARLRLIPGVSAVGGGVGVPLGSLRTRFLRSGDTTPEKQRPMAAVGVVSPELLPLLGIRIISGRGFTSEDRTGLPFKAMINQSFARRFLPDGVGSILRLGFWNGQMKPWSEFQVIGVVGDTRNRSLDAAAEPAIYLSSLQVPSEGFLYMAKTSRDAASLEKEFRDAVWSVDRNIEEIHPRPLERHVEGGLQERRLIVWILGGFAAISLLLAAAGLAATLAASVTESRREIGIRAALGEAPAGAIFRVIRGAGRMTLFGLMAGVTGTAVATQLLKSLIPGVSPLDPIVLSGAGILLAVAALLAAASPAWRAARADPMECLREG